MSVRYKTIQDFPRYRVGDDGSFWKYQTGRTHQRVFKWERLSGMKLKQGHILVRLSSDTGKKRTVYLHCLVLEAFVGPCPKGKQCCHEDDNGFDNRLKNLRWDTHKANFADALRNGRVSAGYLNRSEHKPKMLKGIKSPSSKLTVSDVLFIRSNRGLLSIPKIARRLSVSHGTVENVIYGKTYTDVTESWERL